MSTSPVVVVREPRDLVAVVPYRLGFRPVESLVVLCLRGAQRQVGLVMRVDLPSAGALPQVVRRLAAHAASDQADQAVVVVYTASPSPCDLTEVVAEGLAEHGVALRDAWEVGPTRFRSLACGDDRCCPVDGWPLEVLDGAQVAAEMVALGRAVLGSRDDLAGDLGPDPDPAVRRAVRELVDAEARRVPRRGPGTSWRRRALATWRRTVEAGRPDDSDAAVLIVALADPRVRDAVLLECVPGGGPAADETVVTPPLAPAPTAARVLDGVFSARGAVVPDGDRLEVADDVLRSLVRVGPSGRHVDPLALLAWSAWWAGDGGRAGVLVDRALAQDPGHRLALLVSTALDSGTPPGWVQAGRGQQRLR